MPRCFGTSGIWWGFFRITIFFYLIEAVFAANWTNTSLSIEKKVATAIHHSSSPGLHVCCALFSSMSQAIGKVVHNKRQGLCFYLSRFQDWEKCPEFNWSNVLRSSRIVIVIFSTKNLGLLFQSLIKIPFFLRSFFIVPLIFRELLHPFLD